MPTLHRNHSIATTVSDCSPAQYESFEAPYKSSPVTSVLFCLLPSTYSRILYLGQRDTTGGYLLEVAKAPPESLVSIILVLTGLQFPVRLPASPHRPQTRLRVLCMEVECSGVALRSLISLLLLSAVQGVVLLSPISLHRPLLSTFGAPFVTAWLRILLVQSFTTLDSSTMRWCRNFPMAYQSLNLARSEARLTFKMTRRN